MVIPTIPALLLLPKRIDQHGDLVHSMLATPASDYIRAFMPHLMPHHWRFMDNTAWILPLRLLLPDQQAALRQIGARDVEASTFCFFTEYPDGLQHYRTAILNHHLCVFNTGDDEPNFYIEAYVVRKES